MANRRKIKVVYRKLGKEKAWGQCHDDCIEIDERVFGKKHLEILVHEMIHWINPEDSEDQVIKKSVLITNTLWSEGYRRIDNNNIEPLQDGKK